ncbi:hypothetical protein [Paenibacillus ferrarius]|uniref:hypothetical protein n=1 Tax=Paenibacillus ferrarius TaxID=1469647 RepID=UPI003D26BF81
MGTRYIKLFGLICGIVAVNIVVFSPGFIGVAFGASALSTASGATLILASALALLYGTYSLIFKLPAAVSVKQIQTQEDYVEALSHYRRVKVLEEPMRLALSQLERIQKKKATLLETLNQRFEASELSYARFVSVIQEIEQLFYRNLKSILNRLGAFDETEFKSVTGAGSSKLPPALLQERKAVYSEYLSFTSSSLGTNEEILLKLDKLLLEISRLDSLEIGDIEKMPCMQEIDTLIKQTKYYKN